MALESVPDSLHTLPFTLLEVLTEQPCDLIDVAVHRDCGAVGIVPAQRLGDRFVSAERLQRTSAPFDAT